MPGWDAATKKLRDTDKLHVVGLIQEQHAERCRLYAQWKQFEWPILQDQMTSFGLAVVPVAILIDEHGIVQATKFRANDIEKLVGKDSDPPSEPAPVLNQKWLNLEYLGANTDLEKASVGETIWYGDTFLKSLSLSKALTAYRAALSKAEASDNKKLIPEVNFRLGVVMRAKFDNSELSNPDDFSAAAKFWTKAIEGNPNQYIWRRRIQQYGPRQIKPYPFYDWVDEAIADIKARGEQPVNLNVPLSGAEIAQPSKQKINLKKQSKNPDPNSKITLIEDDKPLIKHVSTVVPGSVKAGQAVRIHLQFFPANNGKWNNEASPMQVWINESENGELSQQLLTVRNANTASSSEPRVLEFEFQTNKDAKSCIVSGFALFNVCTVDNGQCLYRRQDFNIEIPLN